MAKLFLRDIGSHPERDLEITLFPDGELQFEADNGKYVHINIAREGVKELLNFLLNETRKKISTVERQYLCERCGHAESEHPNRKCAAFARR